MQRSMSERVTGTLSLSEKPADSSFVRLSASTFSSRGLHLRSKLKRAFAKEEDNCMLISIRGHLVVDLLEVSASFAILSVPALNARVTVCRVVPSLNHPNACSAHKEESNSAEVDAH